MHAPVLRYFAEVARAGSIRQAARQLNVAASAVNRQVLKLEQELGLELFERVPSGLRLTPAGEIVLRHARATLYEFDRLKTELDALQGVRTGLVRLASLDSLMVDLLPRTITAFHRSNPAVRFAVTACGPGEVANRVANGDADIGIAFDIEQHAGVTVAADIASPIRAMVSPDHPLAEAPAVTLLDCAKYPLLFQEDTQPIRTLLDMELAEAKTASRHLLVANNLSLIKGLVCAGIGVAFYTSIGFVNELSEGSVVAVPLKERRLSDLRLTLLQPRERRPTPAAAALIQHLADALSAFKDGTVDRSRRGDAC